MWVLVLMVLLLVVTPSFAEPNFSEQYERATISSIRPVSMRPAIRSIPPTNTIRIIP